MLTPEVQSFVRMAAQVKYGHLPRVGGLLDQTIAFLDGLAVFQSDDAAQENEAVAAASEDK